MAEQNQQVRALVVPLDGMALVLPDSIILQVLTSAPVTAYENSPKWLSGSVEWQKRKIPTLSFEVASGYRSERAADVRTIIMKSLNHHEHMPFYALLLSGIPHPVSVDKDNIQSVENASINSPLILSQVLVEGEPASIPNLDALEEMLMSQYGLFQQSEA